MFNNKYLVIISPQIYPCKMGGIEVFNYYLSNELKKHYPIYLLTSCDTIDIENIEVHKLKSKKFSKIRLPLSILFFIINNRKSIKLIYLGYARSYWTYWIVFIISKKIFGVDYGLTIHGGSKLKLRPKFPFKLLFRNAEFITGVSSKITKEYAKRSDREIIYTPPLIPFDIISLKNKYRTKWKISSEEIVLLYVGSLKPLKSVDTLIEALGVISVEKLQKYKLRVLIAGDGVSRKELEGRVNELDLQEIVNFLGVVDRDNINQLYNLANIYTICSEFEGLPISLLEAFANNLPCITSDAPGLKEVSLNNKNTLLFKTKDYYDYANKIEILLNDNQLQENLKNEASKYFEEFYSYDILVNEFKKLIEKVN